MAAACAFCRIDVTEGSHLVLEEPRVIGFLDRRPVFPGHVLVSPRTHHETLVDLPDALVRPLFLAVRRVAAALPPALGAQGTFVAVNNVVSQSVPHLHVHVVPRSRGDGLRGFFWPRQRYAGEEEMAATAVAIRAVLDRPGQVGQA